MSLDWPVRGGWLAQVQETPLEPALPIIDAHHHLWKLPHDTYLLDDFLADLARAVTRPLAIDYLSVANPMISPDGVTIDRHLDIDIEGRSARLRVPGLIEARAGLRPG